jgi:hypothetical protein
LHPSRPATEQPHAPFAVQHPAEVIAQTFVEQSRHIEPAAPQIAAVSPVRHLPCASQQPAQIVEQ